MPLVKSFPEWVFGSGLELHHQIDQSGSAVVWCGQQEQASSTPATSREGLTMAPLEPACGKAS